MPAAASARTPQEATGTPAAPRQPLRFLFWAADGGAADARWLVDAAHAAQTRGHSVCVAGRRDGAALGRARDAGLVVRALAARARFDPRAYFGRRGLLAASRPDAIVVQDPQALRHVAGAARRFGAARRAGALVYAAQAGDSAVAAVGGTNLAHPGGLWTGIGAPPPGTSRVGEAVELFAPGQPPDRIALRRELRLPRRAWLVAHAGELASGQGHATSLRALAILAAEARAGSLGLPVPTLLCVGTGPEESRLHVLAHELGVKDQVLWIGFRKDVRRYVAACDALVLPSVTTGSRWPVLDAMACSVPVIAAPAAAIADLVRDGITGALVPGDDPVALAAALAAIGRDPGRAASWASAARTQVAQHTSVRALGAELECWVYTARLNRRRPPGNERAALFVDRDGTLVRNVPYNADPAAVALEPNAARALRWIRAAGFRVVVVSNQSAVARGLCDESQVHAVHARLRELLQHEAVTLDAIEFCPHHPDYGPECDCRKPQPGLLLRAARDLEIDLARSVVVGDAPSDLEAGRRAGIAGFAYVANGHAGPAAGAVALGPAAAFPAGTPLHTEWVEIAAELLRSAWEAASGAGRR